MKKENTNMTKQGKKLEELVRMAEEHKLEKKPSEVLNVNDAKRFIMLFAKSNPGAAFSAGMRLKDEEMIDSSIKQMLEQGYRGYELGEAYKYTYKKSKYYSISFDLRQRTLEKYPEICYDLDFKEHQENAETADRTDLWSLNDKLLESRQYLAAIKPRESARIGSRKENGSEQDPVLSALSSAYCLLEDLMSGCYNSLSTEHHNPHALLVSKFAINLLKKKGEVKEGEYEKEREVQWLSQVAYSCSLRTFDSRLKEEAREFYAEYNPESAANSALRWHDPDLAKRVLGILVSDENLYFHEFTRNNESHKGNLAYELTKKYGFDNLREKVTQRIISRNPENAFEYGLRNNDSYLIKAAKKVLGKKASSKKIALFKSKAMQE